MITIGKFLWLNAGYKAVYIILQKHVFVYIFA